MPQIGPMEILVVGVIALIVFGPQKLPEIARSVGRAASELRRMATEVRDEFEAGINLEDREEEKKEEEEGEEEEGEEEEGEEEEAEAGDQAPEAEEAATSTAPQTNKVVGPAPEADEGATSTAPQTNKVVGPAPEADEGATSTAPQTKKVVGPTPTDDQPEG
jgi:sec-independent protein translocase protein TatB